MYFIMLSCLKLHRSCSRARLQLFKIWSKVSWFPHNLQRVLSFFPQRRRLSAVGSALMAARVIKLSTPLGKLKMIDLQVRSPLSNSTSFKNPLETLKVLLLISRILFVLRKVSFFFTLCYLQIYIFWLFNIVLTNGSVTLWHFLWPFWFPYDFTI